ncbi:NIPSNAP family protein [Actinoallomurus soli]|uniref:NIPSNAP family protein n=1 Tax=Actinoallomurus soli TaxID=2952535 RepID=UPI002092EA83|nr:NIPSNAP family protein [Actinoallomurus soli]MCO5973623.1 NIPSNAP family protein [Actinoallomurus soli]
MLYELATLSVHLWSIPKLLPTLDRYTVAAPGRLLGCWETEIGEILTRLLVLRGFADAEELSAERERLLLTDDPFDIGEHLVGMRLETYRMFDFVPDVEPGEYGSVYEFRTYELKIGGLAPTMAGWKAAVPARTAMYPLTAAMYGLDGVPRITHIWPFPDFNARIAIRKESYDTGIWPPRNGPENIAHATSTIAIPTPISPLR